MRGARRETLLGLDAGPWLRAALVVLAVGVAAGALAFGWLAGDRDRLVVRVVVYGGYFVSVVLHELAHSAVAYVGGDREIRARGYLTLNPLRYLDPVWSLGMPMLFILLGGLPLFGARTLVDDRALRSDGWRAAVSLAGPAVNLLFAAVIAGALLAGLVDPYSRLGLGLSFLAFLEVSAVLFNLIPFPPLDGYGAIRHMLPAHVLVSTDGLRRNGYFILIGAFWFIPGVGDFFWNDVYRFAGSLRLDPLAVELGRALAQFR